MTRRIGLALALTFVGSACATAKLHQAVEAGNAAEVKRLLDSGEKVEARDPNEGATPLCMAAANGNLEIAETLVARGAGVDTRSAGGVTALHCAAWNDRAEVAAFLIAKGAHVSATTEGRRETPLHRALAQYGPQRRGPRTPVPDDRLAAMMATAALLLEHGADPNAATSEGVTPLHYAAVTGHKPAAELLVARGAQVDARTAEGVTPLFVAAGASMPDTTEFLLAHGAQVDARTRSGFTPLANAAKSGSVSVARLLVAKGAEVNARDSRDATPLFQALWVGSLASPSGRAMLAKRGAGEKELREFRRDLSALEGKWLEVARLLLDHGADPGAHPASAAAPLQLAIVTGDVELVGALLARGAPINLVSDGETALHAAAAERQVRIVMLLLEKGADVKAVNMTRRTPLHFAAAFLDDPAVIDALVNRGAEVNTVDGDGRTPLQYAERAKNTRSAEALRSFGAK